MQYPCKHKSCPVLEVVTALCWQFAALSNCFLHVVVVGWCYLYFYKAVILNVVTWGAKANGSHLPLGRAAQPRTAWAPAVCSSPAHQWSTQTGWWRLPCQWSQLSSYADLKEKEKSKTKDMKTAVPSKCGFTGSKVYTSTMDFSSCSFFEVDNLPTLYLRESI